jgi:transposase
MLPNKVKAFSQTLSVKTVNDKTSAQAIAYMGLEKKLDLWQPPHEVFNKLKQLTREREQLIQERTICKNQLHAEESGAWPNKGSIKRIKQRILLMDKQVNEVEAEIKEIVCMNHWLQEKLEYVCSIKGVALITAVTIAAETNGFNLIRNKKQLVSYAGLDVISKESGISVKGKSKISRKGNKYIRKALHFPALVAVRHNEQMKALYSRLVSKHGIKMKAAVAVQKRILELVYVLWKKEEMFDLEYFKNKGQQTSVATLCELT